MKKLMYSGAIAVALSLMPMAGVQAETGAKDHGAAKLNDAQCTALWSKAADGATGDLTMEKVQPFVKDFKSADMNGDAKLSTSEWTNACKKGWIMSDAGSAASGANSGAAPAATSDRTPAGATERTPGASETGAAGTEAGQTNSGTSDRTPGK